MKILIADDETLARKRILNILEKESEPYQLDEASSGKEAILKINTTQPDIVFLDIKMTDLTGFEVIEHIDTAVLPIIVFVTAFDHFAIKAFEVEAVDFLLKPYKNDRLLAALHRAIARVNSKERDAYQEKVQLLLQQLATQNVAPNTNNTPYLEKIALKMGKKYVFADTVQIKYITSSSYYAEIFMQDGKKHVYRSSMAALLEKLNPNRFLRINRSTIVAIPEIKEVISEGLGDYSITMKDRTAFSVTKNYRQAFLKIMGIKS